MRKLHATAWLCRAHMHMRSMARQCRFLGCLMGSMVSPYSTRDSQDHHARNNNDRASCAHSACMLRPRSCITVLRACCMATHASLAVLRLDLQRPDSAITDAAAQHSHTGHARQLRNVHLIIVYGPCAPTSMLGMSYASNGVYKQTNNDCVLKARACRSSCPMSMSGCILKLTLAGC